MNNDDIKQQKHKARQQKIKQGVDKRVAQATIKKGVLLVITGNGKGKSTSGFGTITRALGHGLSAGCVQFIKGKWECGELNILNQHGLDTYIMGTGFTWETQDKKQDEAAAKIAWQKAKVMLSDPSKDIVLLDELTYMIKYGYLDLDDIIDTFNKRPPMQHVIVTGRACHRRLLELADTVSEVQPVKHAFKAGVKAQKGFDW